MQSFSNKAGKSIVETMISAIQANKNYLSEVDGLIGDGDHGANMNKGFTMCQKSIADQEMGFTDSLGELGMILLNDIGGSMGPIYGTIFLTMAEEGAESERITAANFAAMLYRAVDALETIVQARVGDKTLMDTLVPAKSAFISAIERNCEFVEALDEMALAAETGKESTRDLVAKFGRSSRLGERSRGVLDAGAVSCNIILQALVRGIKELIEKS